MPAEAQLVSLPVDTEEGELRVSQTGWAGVLCLFSSKSYRLRCCPTDLPEAQVVSPGFGKVLLKGPELSVCSFKAVLFFFFFPLIRCETQDRAM